MEKKTTEAIALESLTFKGKTGKFSFGRYTIEIKDVQKNYGTGKKTVYTGSATSEDGQTIEFTNADINAIQTKLGYRTSSAAATIRVMNEDEVNEVVNKEVERAQALFTRFSEFCNRYKFEVAPFDKEGFRASVDKEINAKVAEAVFKKHEAEAKKREADNKRERRELSNKVKDIQDDIQKKIIDATCRGDFAEVARLVALKQEQETK